MGPLQREELQRRLDELIDEVRRYPTPIARCDEQLPALLEQRAAVLEQLRRLDDKPLGCSPAATWINDGGFNAA